MFFILNSITKEASAAEKGIKLGEMRKN